MFSFHEENQIYSVYLLAGEGKSLLCILWMSHRVSYEAVYIYCILKIKTTKYEQHLDFPFLIQYSLAQSCSHIGGLLMYLHHLHLSQILRTESATSKSCQWSVPRPMKMEPKPLREWNFGRPKLSDAGEVEARERKQISFDPRHPDDRAFDIGNSMQQLKLLRDLFPNTGNHSLWKPF